MGERSEQEEQEEQEEHEGLDQRHLLFGDGRSDVHRVPDVLHHGLHAIALNERSK